MRSILRSVALYQSSNFKPKVVGSAWTPWVRPMVGVCLNSTARRFKTSASFSRSSIRTADACLICTLRPVSLTSVEVRPIWMYLASSPTYSPTLVRKAMMSWLISRSISWMRSTSKSAFSLITRTASFGIRPSSAFASQAAISTSSMVCHSLRSSQIFPISGRVYLGIMYRSPFLIRRPAPLSPGPSRYFRRHGPALPVLLLHQHYNVCLAPRIVLFRRQSRRVVRIFPDSWPG